MLEGLLCYDRWVDEFASDPERKRGTGDSYCLGVYRSTHKRAGEYLREIAPRYPEAAEHLTEAAKHFTAEGNTLDVACSLLGWESPEGPDPERNAKVATILSTARDSYRRGIECVEAALPKIPEGGIVAVRD